MSKERSPFPQPFASFFNRFEKQKPPVKNRKPALEHLYFGDMVFNAFDPYRVNKMYNGHDRFTKKQQAETGGDPLAYDKAITDASRDYTKDSIRTMIGWMIGRRDSAVQTGANRTRRLGPGIFQLR